MTSSRKKVIVRTLTGPPAPGYLPPKSFIHRSHPVDPGGLSPLLTLDLLDLDGRTVPMPLCDVKLICFVRDFNRDDPTNPERLTRRAFLSRPRAEGLWLRLTFPAGEQLEGLATPDLTLLDGLIEDAGLFLTPPDERANTHRIYVPRTAIVTLDILAVIKAAESRPATRLRPSQDQATLFPF